MQWFRARQDGLFRCGSCRVAITKGDIYARTKFQATRCESCARKIEDPPEVIEDEFSTSVPDGVRHQPSLGLTPASDLADRFISRHGR